MELIKAAVIQNKPDYDKEANISHALSLIEEAVQKGAKLITLPEIFFYPYELLALRRVADTDSSTLEQLQQAALKHKIFLCTGSLAVKEKDSKNIRNTAYLIDSSGEVLLEYSKSHLFDVKFKELHVRESAIFTPGNETKVVKTSIGTISILICYDIRFPELARTCVLKGAEIIIVPAAFNTVTGPPHWQALFQARAIENQVFILAASQARVDKSQYQAYGHSLIVDPWGTIKAEAGIGEEIIYTELDPHVLNDTRKRLPLLKQRRPDLYKV
jgi:predicted amidohydrolase